MWNKLDLLAQDARDATLAQAARRDDLYAVSAITGEGMDDLLADMADKLKDPRKEETLTLTFAQGRQRAWLYDAGIVTDEVQTDEGYGLTVFWTKLQKERFVRL